MEDGRQLASFKERTFGITMNWGAEAGNVHTVEMFEDQGSKEFFFDESDGLKLKWRAPEENSQASAWTGWALRDNPPEVYKGNPQLFWISSTSTEESLPQSFERVDLIPEYL